MEYVTVRDYLLSIPEGKDKEWLAAFFEMMTVRFGYTYWRGEFKKQDLEERREAAYKWLGKEVPKCQNTG